MTRPGRTAGAAVGGGVGGNLDPIAWPTIYVHPGGDNNNSGVIPSLAKATIAAAVEFIDDELGSGRILLSADYHEIDTPIVVNTEVLIIEGQGRRSSFITFSTNEPDPMFSVSANQQFLVKHLYCYAPATKVAFLYEAGGYGPVFEDVYFGSGGAAIRLDSEVVTGVVSGCYFDNTEVGVYLAADCRGFTISDCRFEGTPDAIQLNGKGCVVDRCHFQSPAAIDIGATAESAKVSLCHFNGHGATDNVVVAAGATGTRLIANSGMNLDDSGTGTQTIG